MAVSIRELFLIVRAQDQASRNLRFVGQNLRQLSSRQDLLNAKSRAANKLAVAQNALAAKQLRLHEAQATTMTRRATLDDESIKRGKLQVTTMGKMNDLISKRSELEQKAALLSSALSRGGTITGRDIGMTGPGSTKFLKRADVQATLRKAQEGAAGLAGEERKLAEAFNVQNAATMAAGAGLRKAEVAEEGLGLSVASASHRVEDATAALREHQKALDNFNLQRLGATGRALTNAGRTMQFVGGVAAAGLGLAANSAANFSRQTELAATQAGNSLQQIGNKSTKIQNVVLDQMRKFPATADQMTQSLYDIFSGTNVQKIGKGAQLLRLFNKAAVAGQTDLNTATQAGITILNAYGLKVSQMPKLLNTMFSAVRFGRMNFGEFGDSLNQIVPAFKGANQSINTMLGSLAFLTRRMPNVRMASTSLARMVEALSVPKLSRNLSKVGVQIKDMHGQLLPIPTVLERILKKFPQLAKGGNIQNWLKEWSGQTGYIQARRALVHIMQSFGQYQQMLKQVSGDQNEFTRSFAALSKTPGNQWAVMLNNLKVLWLNLGRAALPAILDMSKGIMTVVGGLNSLGNATQISIGHWLVYGAALTIVVGLFTQIIGIWMTFISVVGSWGFIKGGITSIKLLATEMSAAALAGEGMLAAMTPLLPVLIAVGVAIAAFGIYKLVTGMNEGADSTDKLWQAMKNGESAAENFGKKIDGLAGAFANLREQQMTVRQLVKSGAGRTEIGSAKVTARRDREEFNREMAARTGEAEKQANAIKAAFSAINLPRPHPAAGSVGSELQKRFGKDSLDPFRGLRDEGRKSLEKILPMLPKALRAYSDLTLEGLNPASKAAKDFRTQIVNMESAVMHLGKGPHDLLQHLSDLLGRPAAPNELHMAEHLNKRIIPATATFAKLTGSLPSKQVVRLFLDHKQASQSLAAFVGVMRKMPNKKQLRILTNIPDQALPWLIKFMRQFHRIPTHKEVKVEVDKENKAQRKINQTRTELSNLAKHQHDMRIAGHVDPKLTQAVQKAQQQLNHLTQVAKKKREADVQLKFKPNYSQFVTQAHNAGAAAKQGIVNGAAGLEQALEAEWIPAIINAVQNTKKAALQAKSPSRYTERELGIPMMQGIIKGVRDQAPALQHAMHKAVQGSTTGAVATRAAFLRNVGKHWLKELSNAGITLLASGQFRGKMSTHAEKIAKQMGVYLGKNHTWTLAGESIGALIANGINRALIKQAGGKGALKTMVDTMASTFDDIKSTVTDAFGGIFQGTATNTTLQTVMGFGGKVPFNLVRGDLAAQIGTFKRWTTALKRLRRRGIPGALYQQLLAAGPASLPAVEALASASPQQLRQYDRMFKHEQKQIASQTKAAFGVQMDIWKNMGKNMAFGILTGLKTESPAIINWLRHLVKKMFYEVQKGNKSHSPSKLYAEEGKNMLDGLQMGMRSYTPSFALPHGGWSRGHGQGGGVHYHLHQNLVRTTESEATFMRKARYHYESRIPRQ